MIAEGISADTWRLLPVCSPLRSFWHGLRWRGSTTDGRPIWVESRDHGSYWSEQSLDPDGTGLCARWYGPDGQVHALLLLPPTVGQGCIDELSWQTVWRWHKTQLDSGMQDAWSEWLSEQARLVWGDLGVTLTDCQVPPLMTTLADPDDFSVSAHSPLESVLCLEAGPGAIWQVWGTRSAIGSLRDFVRHCPGVGSPHRLQAIRGEPAHETDATASALVDLPIGLQTQGTCWQFSLRMPVLSATQLNGLHTGCLLLAEVSTQAQTLCLPVVAMAGQTPPDCALRACAALTLCLTAGQHHDTFELRWDTFMPAFSDKPMGERQRISSMSAVSATESISTQLMCVIGSRHMLLSELLQLQAGDLLTLQDFPLPHVLLLLGDKKIGTGELVRCGQTLAVQIVEWMADPVYASEQSSGPARASSHDGDVCPVQADAVSPSHPERDSAS